MMFSMSNLYAPVNIRGKVLRGYCENDSEITLLTELFSCLYYECFNISGFSYVTERKHLQNMTPISKAKKHWKEETNEPELMH